MPKNEKFRNAFLGVLYSESVTIFVMAISLIIIKNTNNEVKNSLGNPSDIGFGWGILFGGWTLYAPIFFIILGELTIYAVSILFRIKYYLNIPIDGNRHMFLLVFSWVLYSFVPILLLSGIFNTNTIGVGILLAVIDILILYFNYLKLGENDG